MAATHSFSNFFAHSVPKKSKRAKDSGEISSFGLDSLVGSADYSGREAPSWCFASKTLIKKSKATPVLWQRPHSIIAMDVQNMLW